MNDINKPFYHFIPQSSKKEEEMVKIGVEHRNPFKSINEDEINIGIFGDENVNKAELGFKFVYEEFYTEYYTNFQIKFIDIKLTKIMDACNEMNKVTVIDSTFVNDIKKSYYSLLQGFIFVFK